MQLTDNDNFWKSEGFYADRLSITEATVLPEVKTITAEYWDELLRNDTQTSKPEKEEENGNSHNTFINDILGYNESWLMIAQAAEMQTFTVIKMFDTQYDYQYKDIAISELSTSENKPEEFVSYEEHTFGSGDDASNMAKFFSSQISYGSKIMEFPMPVQHLKQPSHPAVSAFTISFSLYVRPSDISSRLHSRIICNSFFCNFFHVTIIA